MSERFLVEIEMTEAELLQLRADLADAENDSLELEGWTLYALAQRLCEAAGMEGGSEAVNHD